MSGVAAIYDRAGSAAPADDLAPLLRAIEHRGTAQFMWRGDSVAMGQRTLAATPEAAAESLPVGVAGGMCQVALDGRLDNREEIAAALGFALREKRLADTGLIALAYDRWGDACVERLVGDFAFVLWDRRRYRLLAARDQRGFRPLVYGRTGSRLVLGSEPRQLLAGAALPADVNQTFLACHLTGAPPVAGGTPYRAVSEVPPAHVLIAEGDSVRLREYWRFGPRPLLRYRRREEYVEHFEETFGRAVAAAVRSPAPPAVLLSGGLDSSYLLARAAEQRPDVGAITFFAEGNETMDERAYSRAVGERLGVPLSEVPADDCWSLSRRYLSDSTFDQPAQPVQAPLMMKAGHVARDESVPVLLDGTGGDEFMAGSSDYLARMMLAGQWLRAGRETLTWSRQTGVPATRVLTRAALLPMLPRSLRAGYRALTGRVPFSSLPPWIDGGALNRMGLDHALDVPQPDSVWGRRGALRRFWSFHVSDGLPVFAWRDRHAFLPMGVEVRSPLWDLRVVEMVLRTPAWAHRDAGTTKAMLRTAMRPRLPGQVAGRTDKGAFDPLLITGLVGEERERADLALGGGPLADLPYVNGRVLQRELAAYRSHRHPWWHNLWRAVTAGLWLHTNEVSRGHTADRLEESYVWE